MSLDTDLDIPLPSSRELELESLLRQRDSQLSALTYEIKHLRRSIVSLSEEKTTTGQALADADADGAPAPAPPSPTDPVTLPPSLIAVLSPHLHINPGASSTVSSKSAGNNTVNAALLQRARVLQEENDELYTLLRVGEVGRLREEVKGLRRVVKRLEGALRESHQVITTLSNELDKTHTALLSTAQRASHTPSTKSISQSPRASYRPISPIEHTSATANGPSGGGGGRLPPTGPRAYKKPRLSDAPSSQSHSQARQRSVSAAAISAVHQQYQPQHRTHGGRTTRDHGSSSRRGKGGGGGYVNNGGNNSMDVDGDARLRPVSVERVKERDRDRERDRERDRNRERERDKSRRDGSNNGGGGGGGGHRRSGGERNTYSGGRGSRASHEHGHASTSGNDFAAHSGDRTLRERMGL